MPLDRWRRLYISQGQNNGRGRLEPPSSRDQEAARSTTNVDHDRPIDSFRAGDTALRNAVIVGNAETAAGPTLRLKTGAINFQRRSTSAARRVFRPTDPAFALVHACSRSFSPAAFFMYGANKSMGI